MIWDFILNRIPWEIQVAAIAIPVVVGFMIAGNLLGWDRVRKFFLPALAIIAALGLLGRARQQGYRDREERGERETTDAIRQANAARDDADALNADDKRLRDDDGFKRRNPKSRV